MEQILEQLPIVLKALNIVQPYGVGQAVIACAFAYHGCGHQRINDCGVRGSSRNFHQGVCLCLHCGTYLESLWGCRTNIFMSCN